MNPTLSGRVVRLEPLAESHREPLRAAAQSEAIWEFNLVSGFGPAFDSWFDAALAGQSAVTRVPYAVITVQDNVAIGSTSFLDPSPAHRRVEIGSTWYLPAFWNTGVNPECKLLLLTQAFDVMAMNRVSFQVDLKNLRSQRAVTKLGAVREGVLRKHCITYTGRERDTVVFSITAQKWAGIRERLTKRLAGAGS